MTTHSKLRPSLWDDSEPDYAPYLKTQNGVSRWVCPAKYVKAGYAQKTFRFEKDADQRDIARVCRELTREVILWWQGEQETKLNEGTWGWLIQRYIHDEFSGIFDVQPQTRADYIKELTKISEAIGDARILDTDFAEISRWKRLMEENGRSRHYIKKWFTHFGLIVSHGIKLQEPGCAEVKAIRSEMRIKNPPRRSIFAERGDILAVVEEADRRGEHWLSLAVLMRFWWSLRGNDVYGKWEPAEGRESGILHNGRIWTDGMTWDMVNQNCTALTKIISKTKDSQPEPYTFDLSIVPDIRERLLRVPEDRRVGPIIVTESGKPPHNDRATKLFKTIVRTLGLPDDLRISDTRSGGITEASGHVDSFTLRNAAQHSQVSTTDLYVRGRSAAANKVVALRRGK